MKLWNDGIATLNQFKNTILNKLDMLTILCLIIIMKRILLLIRCFIKILSDDNKFFQ